ncbi:hypothetical protein DERF_003500 [Dermatophagoides farinae]|uniref:Uncharacterized protein n=1 Tax=Dermatophagoides farinae TaxID=6954 RepID=A0A922IH74_DERFA|nr:hypothetical protein DERF_003500 [Dermatophagoides farinae]
MKQNPGIQGDQQQQQQQQKKITQLCTCFISGFRFSTQTHTQTDSSYSSRPRYTTTTNYTRVVYKYPIFFDIVTDQE